MIVATVLVAVLTASWVGIALSATAVLDWVRGRLGNGGNGPLAFAFAVGMLVAAASAATLMGILLFAEFVQIVGRPFFASLSRQLEEQLAAPAQPRVIARDQPWWKTLPRATAQSLAVLAIYLGIAIPLLALGLVPVLGQTVVPVAEALLAAWFLAAELTQIPLERRRLGLWDRHLFLRSDPAATIGFGLASLLLFLVPLANVLALPGVALGATIFVFEREREREREP